MIQNEISAEEVNLARMDMAAMLRIAANENLHEGIDNHFSYMFEDGTFLVNRWAVHWSEMRACDILRIDESGNILEGDGEVEITAFYIHEAIHRLCPHARTILHTHMPYATSIACTEGGFNERLSQMSLNLYKRVAYEEYGGLAVNKSEGDRMAGNIGDKAVIMLKNHGVLVMAKTMAMAIYDLYFLERAAKVQVLAESTGKPLTLIPEDIAELTYRQLAVQGEDKESYFKVMKRLLDENSPEYKDL